MATRLYTIQAHKTARPTHYDLRLEMFGTMKSWVLPKMPPRKIGEKRLAVQTANHTKAYATWEGKIPAGEYGAGTVNLWDVGEYDIISRQKNKLVIEIRGKKLKGHYALVKYREPASWLFIKVNKPK